MRLISTLTRNERSLTPPSGELGVRVSNPWDLSSRIESVGSPLVQISSKSAQRSLGCRTVYLRFPLMVFRPRKGNLLT